MVYTVYLLHKRCAVKGMKKSGNKDFSVYMKDIAKDHAMHNVGQCLWITSVNRTTGEMTMTYKNPWPAYNKMREEEE